MQKAGWLSETGGEGYSVVEERGEDVGVLGFELPSGRLSAYEISHSYEEKPEERCYLNLNPSP